MLSTSCAADGTVPRPKSPNSTMVELGVPGSSSTGCSRFPDTGSKGGLLEPSPMGPGMSRGLMVGLGLAFVGVAELFWELREDAESLRSTKMESLRGSTGEKVMVGAFPDAG